MDNDLEAAVLRDGRVDQSPGFAATADVGHQGLDRGAGLLANGVGGRFNARLITTADHEVASLARQAERRRVTESTTGGHDNGALSL